MLLKDIKSKVFDYQYFISKCGKKIFFFLLLYVQKGQKKCLKFRFLKNKTFHQKYPYLENMILLTFNTLQINQR